MDTYKQYIENIKKYPRIDKKREQELARIMFYSRNLENVKKARQEMINSNLLLVVSRAIKVQQSFAPHIDIMDLIAEGNIGLMKAVKHFRPAHKSNACFCTYAVCVIDQNLVRYASGERFIHLPVNIIRIKHKYDKLQEKYKDKLTDAMIRRKLKIGDVVLQVLKDKNCCPVQYLEDIFPNVVHEYNSAWEYLIEDTNTEAPYHKLSQNLLKEYLDGFFKCLNDREKYIIKMMYLHVPRYDICKLGNILHISKERVRQLSVMALRKLRRAIILDWEAKHPNEVRIKIQRFYNDYNYLTDFNRFSAEQRHRELQYRKIVEDLTL